VDKFRLALLAVGHAVTDAVATMATPLMLVFRDHFQLSGLVASLLVSVMALGTSMAQPLFAYLSDRISRNWLLVLGTWAASVFVYLTAQMPSFGWVLVMMFMGSMGVAAFHPESAVLAGRYAGSRRTLGIGIFVCGGLVGLAAGPMMLTWVVRHAGLEEIYILAIPGLVLVPLLAIYLRDNGKKAGDAPVRKPVRKLPHRRRLVGWVFAVSVVRAASVTGYYAALALLADAHGLPLTTVGLWGSVFLFSGGVAGLTVSLTVPRNREKWANVISFAVSVPALVAFVWCWDMPVVGLLVLALGGAASQGTVPFFIAGAQRLMPQQPAMGGALVMGVSWGVGGAGIAPLAERIGNWVSPEFSLAVMGLLILPAIVLSLALPGRPVGLSSAPTGPKPI